WQYYEKGNRRQRRLVNYRPEKIETQVTLAIAHYSQKFFARYQGSGNTDTSPIFVLGMPRSGSSLLEQIMASHSAVQGLGELPYIMGLERLSKDGFAHDNQSLLYTKLGDRYLQQTQDHRTAGKPHFVDKMPNNFRCVGLIHAILPRAKIIDARRQPMDTCFSNLKQLYAKGQAFSYDQSELGHYYGQYRRMMTHWDKVLPGRVLRVDYEDTVTDLRLQVKRLLAHLELPWEENCLQYYDTQRPIRTASSEQVRRPIYETGVGYWKNFEPGLMTLQNIVEPRNPTQSVANFPRCEGT
ncbi:MAG: sulfotransferase, partial [Halioglobus sp.]